MTATLDLSDPPVFLEWFNEHYEMPRAEPDAPVLAECRRCGKHVAWAIKHATDEHGDEIVGSPLAPAGRR